MAKAVRFDHYGGRDVLYIAEVEVPHPAAGEVVVRIEAAGVNPGEATIREGRLHERYPASFPSGEGSDLAGVVHEVGHGVTLWAVGDEVLGWTENRASHAEYVAVPDGQLVAKPPALSWEVAGSLYVTGCTAYAAVRAVGAGPGDTVVVSAAAGGVGSIAVQLVQVRGARAIGIASAHHHDWLRSVGVTPVAYGEGLLDLIRAAAPSGVNAFVDTFGPEYVHLAVELGVVPGRIDTIIAYDAAVQVGAKTDGSMAATSADVLAEMAELVASGRIVVPIAATYPLEKVADAYAEVEQRHTLGKVVLVP
jgi:NADPH:quinone reductase-like Zn-dependent oxidoreductase